MWFKKCHISVQRQGRSRQMALLVRPVVAQKATGGNRSVWVFGAGAFPPEEGTRTEPLD
ncbi:hypothetical protein [Kamptonema formosum]|uniref:hypothetical protein n=1 Tax=Kamptonema formosum TaxID=331992 RepID=UPI00034995C7|nr:hypothetical protein [Oscillatoria sp. PCC 10802]